MGPSCSQVQAKRCGHRPGKAIVSKYEMVDRIKAAVDAKTDPDFVIMARTDALAVEGLQAAIDRPTVHSLHAPSSFWPRWAEPGVVAAESRIDEEVLREFV